MLRLIEGWDPVWFKAWAGRLKAQEEAAARVRAIVEDVRREGQAAVVRYTQELDGVFLPPESFRVTEEELVAAWESINSQMLLALRRAKENIMDYHRRQLPNSWFMTDKLGNVLGQICRPLQRVGIYIPGGTAAYPSSVLMTALPAKVAGVEEIVLVTPPRPDGSVHPLVLVAALEAGVTEIYKMGGAQAIAALAYGTEYIRPVDKIVGPGNLYVTLAKKEVYGQVDIDMLAGPSEIVVVADKCARPDWVAADLLSQAEHDPLAGAALITPERSLAEAVIQELNKQLKLLPRASIASRALENYGAAIVVKDMYQALERANTLAPEHLELYVTDPWRWLGMVYNAGAIFLGPYSPEPVGDYLAGPSHVLPTGGTGRFYSGLSIDTFIKKSSVIAYHPQGLLDIAREVEELARAEGLEAHARAIALRTRN
ncbi:histidinol dehydrogenase [Thermanaeromonas toyohensis ToBE]|uniref:Histidinol dehydrogenase n=1 Tax=Thermanaeromonas toyohensis ToBE TaxID=698762 RepID=A0A1W1W2F9_9FIRM|nr:histidinol dehydrogenase [Thermanaeromonas toyohensis]SMB99809.1 histidinol dehydrogenase [Thermanaeromonas toyohensis ToBE]